MFFDEYKELEGGCTTQKKMVMNMSTSFLTNQYSGTTVF